MDALRKLEFGSVEFHEAALDLINQLPVAPARQTHKLLAKAIAQHVLGEDEVWNRIKGIMHHAAINKVREREHLTKMKSRIQRNLSGTMFPQPRKIRYKPASETQMQTQPRVVANPTSSNDHGTGMDARVLTSEEVDAVLRDPAEAIVRPQGVVDARCHNFQPDGWQVELMDAVDANKSVLVSAPTSSGKTFIAYYAMEQALQSCADAENKVIYVAPTKALVNQVEAGINARFDKSFKHSTSSVVVGTFTGDFQFDLNRCQILVVTPQCLEILLLNPVFTSKRSHAVDWRKALKYVIFDEIHRLGAEDGRVWERALALLPCPFLALSATLGGLENFKRWLQAVDDDRNGTQASDVVTIVRHVRVNDLDIHHYRCDREQPSTPSNLGRPVAGAEIVRANAIGCVPSLRSQNSLAAIKLIPEDLIQILDLMAASTEAAVQAQYLGLQASKLEIFHHPCDLTMDKMAEFERVIKAAISTLAMDATQQPFV